MMLPVIKKMAMIVVMLMIVAVDNFVSVDKSEDDVGEQKRVDMSIEYSGGRNGEDHVGIQRGH